MLDRAARRLVDPVLEQLAAAAQQRNLTANQVTVAGFGCGLKLFQRQHTGHWGGPRGERALIRFGLVVPSSRREVVRP